MLKGACEAPCWEDVRMVEEWYERRRTNGESGKELVQVFRWVEKVFIPVQGPTGVFCKFHLETIKIRKYKMRQHVNGKRFRTDEV